MAIKKKQITIHKKNELVRGSDRYSLDAKKALNAIYYGIQKSDYKNPIKIKLSTFRDLMNLQKDFRYIDRIKNALKELKQPIELNNYKDPRDNITYSWYLLSFLDEAKFFKENGTWNSIIKVNDTMLQLMQIKGNFTKLDLVQYLNRFRTKYAMKLYEYLKSFERYKYLDVTDAHLRKLLAIENVKEYKYYSALQRLLERQIKEIQSKSDLKNLKMKAYKDLKIFRFEINPKAEKTKPDKQTLEDILQKCIKRF